jgi:hypothetical protein
VLLTAGYTAHPAIAESKLSCSLLPHSGQTQ